MDWTRLPEFNPIENLGYKAGYQISKKKPSTGKELIEAVSAA